MVFSVLFERKTQPSSLLKHLSTVIWVKSQERPNMEKLHDLLDRLYSGDVEDFDC